MKKKFAPVTKISDSEVRKLKARISSGKSSRSAEAKRYGVCISHISRIMNGKRRQNAVANTPKNKSNPKAK